jgi:hypothetical protein
MFMLRQHHRALVCAAIAAGSLGLAACGPGEVAKPIAKSAEEGIVRKEAAAQARAFARASATDSTREAALERDFTADAPELPDPSTPLPSAAAAQQSVESMPLAREATAEVVADAATIDTYLVTTARVRVRACASGAMISVAKAIVVNVAKGSNIDLDDTFVHGMQQCLQDAFPGQADQIKVITTAYYNKIKARAASENAIPQTPVQVEDWWVYTSQQVSPGAALG